MSGSLGYWRTQAALVIQKVHAGLPEVATLDQRMKAVDDAYPFGQRKYHPYKMWLKERRAYLEQYGYQSRGKSKAPHETPLERLMRRGKEAT